MREEDHDEDIFKAFYIEAYDLSLLREDNRDNIKKLEDFPVFKIRKEATPAEIDKVGDYLKYKGIELQPLFNDASSVRFLANQNDSSYKIKCLAKKMYKYQQTNNPYEDVYTEQEAIDALAKLNAGFHRVSFITYNPYDPTGKIPSEYDNNRKASPYVTRLGIDFSVLTNSPAGFCPGKNIAQQIIKQEIYRFCKENIITFHNGDPVVARNKFEKFSSWVYADFAKTKLEPVTVPDKDGNMVNGYAVNACFRNTGFRKLSYESALAQIKQEMEEAQSNSASNKKALEAGLRAEIHAHQHE